MENMFLAEGLFRGKPLMKPKSRMDLYKVNRPVYNFAPTVLDGPFRDHNICELESVTIPTYMLQHLEQDAQMLTMISSFLDCSGFSVNYLFDEASKDTETCETTRQLVEALSDLEKS